MSAPNNPEITTLEKRLIHLLSGDLGRSPRPFLELARCLGLGETEVLEMVRALAERGLLRRFGATLRHQQTGYTANAMAAWIVEEARLEEAGSLLAGFDEVSHCYHRPAAPGWPFNLYTMIHATSSRACRATARRMAVAAGLDRYELLFSIRELKKTSMRYFDQ